jgi:DNA-directed RNA polymerase specialized sigma24 family protein
MMRDTRFAATVDEISALVEQARAGDMPAFETLMRRQERLVMMTALRLLNGNLADAEDAAQTVFLRMHRYLGQFRPRRGPFALVVPGDGNVCHDAHRRAQRRAEVAIDPRADIQ